MPQEQILTELDPAFGYPQIAAIAEQQPIAVFTTNDIADNATDDRRARRSQDHGGNGEIVFGASNDRRNDEDRLSGERQADAFQADETSDDEQAVEVNEVSDGWHGDAVQNAGSSVSALTLPIPQVASVMTAVLLFMTALPLPIDLAWKYLSQRAL